MKAIWINGCGEVMAGMRLRFQKRISTKFALAWLNKPITEPKPNFKRYAAINTLSLSLVFWRCAKK